MPAIRSPEASLWCHDSDDRVEKTPSFIDDVSEPFVMSIGEIPLEWGGLDGIDRQDAQQHRMTGEWFPVRSHNAAASFLDRLPHLRCSPSELIQSAFGRAQTLRSRFGFARAPPGWCTFDHGRNSILVLGGLSLVPDHRHNDGALTLAHIAFRRCTETYSYRDAGRCLPDSEGSFCRMGVEKMSHFRLADHVTGDALFHFTIGFC